MLERLVASGLSMPASFDLDSVAAYLGFLTENDEAGGFFSKGDSEKILERHVFESAIFVDYVVSRTHVSRETTVCDAGTGPGLPGFLFACLHEPPALTLLDSSRRRLHLLEQWAPHRANYAYARVEEFRGKFDIVTARALAPYPHIVELLTSLQKPGGRLVLSLGKEPPPASLGHLGYVSRETYHPSALSFLGERTFLLLEKTTNQDSRYPRPWKIIQQEIRSCRESTP